MSGANKSKLTEKQQAFCKEYLIDLNATQAAIRAGYSEKSARIIAFKLLQNPQIQEELKKLMDARAERTQITSDRVLQELAAIGFMDIRDFFEITEKDGKTGIEPKSLDKIENSKAIAYIGKNGYSFHDKMEALEKIGKHLGMWKNTLELSGSLTSSVLVVPGMAQVEDWTKQVQNYYSQNSTPDNEEPETE